jgi:hypothetical protein
MMMSSLTCGKRRDRPGIHFDLELLALPGVIVITLGGLPGFLEIYLARDLGVTLRRR